MLNGTLGDSQIFWGFFCGLGKGQLLMKAEVLLGMQSLSQWNWEAQLVFAELFKVKFRYIWELGRRFSRSIQKFLMLFGFHDKSDF